MFGVFNGYEKQLVHDWIAKDWVADGSASAPTGKRLPDAFRSRFRTTSGTNQMPTGPVEEIDPDVHELDQRLKDAPGGEKMLTLIQSMSPARHSSLAGLHATKLFVEAMSERMVGANA